MNPSRSHNVQTSAVRLKEAAAVLGVDVSTLRRDVKAGCPTVDLGSVGRNHGTLVNIEEVRRYRAVHRGDVLPIVETAVLELVENGIYARARVTPAQAIVILMKLYERVYELISARPLEKAAVPEQMRHLCSICIRLIEDGHFTEEGE